MTVEVVMPLHETQSRRLLLALHDRDGRSAAGRVVHEHLLLRALGAKPGR